jgi:hypothetical protein
MGGLRRHPEPVTWPVLLTLSDGFFLVNTPAAAGATTAAADERWVPSGILRLAEAWRL